MTYANEGMTLLNEGGPAMIERAGTSPACRSARWR